MLFQYYPEDITVARSTFAKPDPRPIIYARFHGMVAVCSFSNHHGFCQREPVLATPCDEELYRAAIVS
jgi:hypothetical protein